MTAKSAQNPQRSPFTRVIILVFDSMGIGAAPDAAHFGDTNAHTLKHVVEKKGSLRLPVMQKMGLGNIDPEARIEPSANPIAFFGRMQEVSAGKDTTSGHWEIAGFKTLKPLDTFPNGFPDELIRPYKDHIKKDILGNKATSGTAIIDELGETHLKTGCPIVYTSADSVYQIAAHEEVIPLDTLYAQCMFVRKMLDKSRFQVGRVIARPFEGTPGAFRRTANRKDFSLSPPSDTLLNLLQERGVETIGVGKIGNIFNSSGISLERTSHSDLEGLEITREMITAQCHAPRLVFVNLVQLDMDFGHRKDPIGYGRHLESLDPILGHLVDALSPSDLLIITADHGTDPVTPGTDHTREYVPLLVYHQRIQKGKSLGTRKTFSDIAQSIAENFFIPTKAFNVGTSFLKEIL